MLNPDFDPLAMLQELQQQVEKLNHNHQQLVMAFNHQAGALNNLLKSNQHHFDLILEQSRRIDQLTLELLSEKAKKSS